MFKINPATKKKAYRVLAMYLALNMLAEYIIPMKAFALTGGPSQPEVESFEPVSTTEMVNTFTGDFNYNIPLMTVPGPKGGYPINLAYHAGIGMEQEASWVGLGWNINPGVINRNMRGLPDDFKGDEVKRTVYYKPQETWALDYSKFDIIQSSTFTTQTVLQPNGSISANNIEEHIGITRPPAFSYQIHYNNYRGLGYGISMNLTSKCSNIYSSHFTKSLNIVYDSDGGIGVTPSLSYDYVSKKSSDVYINRPTTISLGYNSREGISSLSLSFSKTSTATQKVIQKSRVTSCDDDNGHFIYGNESGFVAISSSNVAPGSGSVFVSSSSMPNNITPASGSNFRFGVSIAHSDELPENVTKTQNKRFNMSYNETHSDQIGEGLKGYGFLYLQDNPGDQAYLLDFNREKNEPATKNTPNIQLAYGTSDLMFANGQGISGAFKPFRSEVASFSDAPVANNFPGGMYQFEFANSDSHTAYEMGGDLGVNYSRTYSGDWDSFNDLVSLEFSSIPASDPLFEPVYFESTGEMIATPLDETSYIGGDGAIRFNLHNVLDPERGIITKVKDEMVSDFRSNSPISIISNRLRPTRHKRSQLMSYRTSGQLDNTTGYGHPVVSLFSVNSFPSASGSPSSLDYGNYPAHHIGEVSVYNPDGYRYVYGLPAYNNEQKEVMFTKDDYTEYDFAKTKTYSPGQDNQVGNSEGMDHFFMSDSIPRYAYSYLITAIYSPDYVDLTGNGPSDDDFGYWVKFNYTKAQSDYGWRVPFRDANYSKNHISDVSDDKLNYMYGTKEVYYLNSIETKTHEANFILNDNSSEIRHDANGAPSENFMTGDPLGTSNRLRYLKKIELVSKKEPGKIIKTVNFEYDYSLCGGGPSYLPNNDHVSVTGNYNMGKLTLKKVWFSYLGNTKGQLSPYTFQYTHDTQTAYDNPNYSLNHMDRWGNYMPDKLTPADGIPILASENPYVNQSAYDNHTDDYAGAWNLKKIGLPSGGEINVEYESDDYAFVQDQQAMQMQRIAGFGRSSSITGASATSNGNKLNDRNDLVFFDLEKTITVGSQTDPDLKKQIEPYVRNIKELYFKAFMKLKHKVGQTTNETDKFAYDYVEGYAKVDPTDTWYGYGAPTGGIVTTGWVKIKMQERNPWNPIGQTDHPMKLAGWQYLRMERPDLFGDGNGFDHNWSMNNVIAGFINMANDFQRLFGYFNFCQSRGYCNELYLSDDEFASTHPKPSYIRLNSPDGHKLGGGHRVKSIRIKDGWDAMSGDTNPASFEYGVEYSYTMPDGTSSGVAEYEPLIGGEEIPQRIPLRYQDRKFPYRNDGLFTEEPFGESLYPAANVGYRRVIAKSIDHSFDKTVGAETVHVPVTKNRSGITVTEFYTAKDFPVISTFTDLKKKNFGIPVIVPFIGEISYNNKGYSQGFCLELNNMHGQLKSQAVYSAFADVNNPNEQPVSKSEYIYQTDAPYDADRANHLSNKVQVLDADGIYREADIGKTHEFYIDRQQHSNFSVTAGLQVNAGAAPANYVFWGNIFPSFEMSYSMYRSISTFKVIERNGVLAEVRSFKDGAYAVNKNLMYDAETGQPLLTQTINNFDQPVYTYNYASHWAYNTMGGAYQNIGARFESVSFPSGTFTYASAENYFVPGDEVEYENTTSHDRTIYWVTAVNAATHQVTLAAEDPSSPAWQSSPGTLMIIRSGRRNQQISSNGTIVSLSNPVTDRRFPLFEAFNAYNANGVEGNTLKAVDFYEDCATGEKKNVGIYWTYPGDLQFVMGEGCSFTVHFPTGIGISSLQDAFGYDLSFNNGHVIATNGTNTYVCSYTYDGTCFKSCLDNVLHAESARFADSWNFNYSDNGDPIYRVSGSSTDQYLSAGGFNAYRFGSKGVWRMQDSWLYQVDRKQSSLSPSKTDISKDGTYKHFQLFDWSSGDPQALNPAWTKTSQVTEYSPFGFELENKDTLDIYLSAMYGYENSLVTAVASNTMHRELAFDGFEDYSAPTSYTTLPAHGHLHFTSVSGSYPILLDNSVAHTGKYSLYVPSNGPAEMNTNVDHSTSGYTLFNPVAGRKYHLSVWVKTSSSACNGQVKVEDVTGSSVLATATPDASKPAIDGWKQVNLDFTAPASSHQLRIELSCINAAGSAWFDDLRVQPFTSGIKTYVYDPNTLWLLAELDDRNYATFYNYDEQGSLVQVKKETENGIATIRTSRSNTKR